jgi:prepilin-type N-terminal cleavage/methylation domain-containing protein
MRTQPFAHTRRRRGVTLLEMLIAATLLAIVATLIFTVFRSATKTMDRAHAETNMMQRVRFALDAVETDLQNVHYRDETTYNTYMTAILNQFEAVRAEAELTDDYTAFEAIYGEQDSRNSDDDPNFIGNPYDKGRLIDLSFGGDDGGLNFSRVRKNIPGVSDFPLGLSRIRYALSGGTLIRTEEPVVLPDMSVYGEVKERDNPPAEEPLAEGVTRFDVAFLFWYDNQWYETPKWDSSERLIRSASHRMVPEDSRGSSSSSSNSLSGNGDPEVLQPGEPGWNEYLNAQSSEPFDALPAYVRIRIAIARDPERPEVGNRVFQRIVRVPGSQESFVRDESLDEKVADAEAAARDDSYVAVLPGVMMLERKP